MPESDAGRRPHYHVDEGHPIGGETADILRGLLHRLQLRYLLRHHNRVHVLAVFSFINGCTSIGLMALVALATHEPFIFPSLGPAAFLFFYTPTAPPASPRNAIIGHAIGAASGWVSLRLFGLEDAGTALVVGVSAPRVLAAALSLGLTSGLMAWLRAPHPPAGATTLIVSLGLLPHVRQLLVLMLAVVMLTLQAFVFNRLAGVPYPVWAAPRSRQPAPVGD